MADAQPIPGDRRFKDLTGKAFGRLIVESFGGMKDGASIWNCRCECGKTSSVRRPNLITGNTKSCGCGIRRAPKSHGMRESREYISWARLISRCTNPKDRQWVNYGGRGISVCERWRSSFANFIADMGPKPSPKHQIDRIDNSGDYEPENCRWATSSQNNRNRRSNRLLTHGGITLCLTDWAERVGINRKTIASRLCRGMSVAEALSHQ